MSSILLYHHLGLGDQFMCHGIVREYCKKYDKVALFSHIHNYPTVSFMYRDLKNLFVIKGDDVFAKKYIFENSSRSGGDKYDDIKLIGFENLDRTSGVPLERQFYRMAGVDLAKKWDSFFVMRDLEKEQALFKKISLPSKYAFVHDDPSRNYDIKTQKITKNLALFKPNKKLTENAFDYCTIIEKAAEVHVIDSSFMFLIDCLDYDNPNQKLFIHRYARENSEWQLPILKKDWYILNTETSRLDPLKDFLISLSDSKIVSKKNTFIKRAVRKTFRLMRWPMIKLKKPPSVELIRRYVPEKSITIIRAPGSVSDVTTSLAKESGSAGAENVNMDSMGKATPSDIVFFSVNQNDIKECMRIFGQLNSITKETFMLELHSMSKRKSHNDSVLSQIESLLESAGFEIREKHIFPLESLFVCRVKKT